MRELMKTKNNQKCFAWKAQHKAEFKQIIEELTGPNMLGHPDFSDEAEPFIFSVETSKLGVGAILSQYQPLKVRVERCSAVKFLLLMRHEV